MIYNLHTWEAEAGISEASPGYRVRSCLQREKGSGVGGRGSEGREGGGKGRKGGGKTKVTKFELISNSEITIPIKVY